MVDLDFDASLRVGNPVVSASDRGGGALLGDFKAEAAGVGPALLWSTKIGGQELTFIAKWLQEFHAENRLEGDHVFLSFALDW